MSKNEKIELTQKEFDDTYTIEEKPKEKKTSIVDPEEILTEAEEEFDNKLKENLNWNEEEDK